MCVVVGDFVRLFPAHTVLDVWRYRSQCAERVQVDDSNYIGEKQ